MNNNDTIRKTLIVAVSLCLVCSALISFSAVELMKLNNSDVKNVPNKTPAIIRHEAILV